MKLYIFANIDKMRRQIPKICNIYVWQTYCKSNMNCAKKQQTALQIRTYRMTIFITSRNSINCVHIQVCIIFELMKTHIQLYFNREKMIKPMNGHLAIIKSVNMPINIMLKLKFHIIISKYAYVYKTQAI